LYLHGFSGLYFQNRNVIFFHKNEYLKVMMKRMDMPVLVKCGRRK
jgi:hypothetical protein